MTTFLTSATHPPPPTHTIKLPIPYPFKRIKIHMTHFVGIATQIPPTGDKYKLRILNTGLGDGANEVFAICNLMIYSKYFRKALNILYVHWMALMMDFSS